MKRPALVPVARFVLDDELRTREQLDEDTITEYVEALKAGAKFPPIEVMIPRKRDSGHSWVTDGWHRLEAHKRLGKDKIRVRYHYGTKDDAVLAAIKANQAHGLRRSNADKNRCVDLALKTWPEKTAREIAKLCGVSHEFVSRKTRPAQSEVSTVDTPAPSQVSEPQELANDTTPQPAAKNTKPANGNGAPTTKPKPDPKRELADAMQSAWEGWQTSGRSPESFVIEARSWLDNFERVFGGTGETAEA